MNERKGCSAGPCCPPSNRCVSATDDCACGLPLASASPSYLHAAADAHLLVSFLDAEGRITSANDLFCRVSGYSVGELVGKDYLGLISSCQTSASPDDLRAALAGHQTWNGELQHRTKDGESFWVKATLLPIAENKFNGFIVVQTDITASKAAECRSLLSESRLSHVNRNLQTNSQKLTDAASGTDAPCAAMSIFLARVSHEIRTPLSAIVATAGLLQESSLTADQKADLDVIVRAGEDVLVLVNEILDLSKLESGHIALEAESFDLRAFAERMGKFMRPKIMEEGLRYNLSFDESLPRRVITDETRLGQVVLNLLANAVKFTSRNGRITLSFQNAGEQRDKTLLKVSVEDSGIGIHPESFPRIFEPFHQADASIARRFGGTGLGMSISKQIIALLQGELEVLSQPGRGSTFFFTIPLEPDHSDKQPDISRPASSSISNLRSDLRVLVAEDNAVNARLLARQLERAGITPTVVADGRSAITAVENSSRGFDLIFMDVQMPGVDGLEATAVIRSIEKQRSFESYIVALTAHAMRGDRESCLDAGMDEFLTKPVNPDMFVATLVRLLSAK